MKSSYIHYIQQHTIIKFLIAFAVSAVLYAMSSFLFPILLAIGLAFALYPLTRMFARLQLGKTGMHPSRVVAIYCFRNFCGNRYFVCGSSAVRADQ